MFDTGLVSPNLDMLFAIEASNNVLRKLAAILDVLLFVAEDNPIYLLVQHFFAQQYILFDVYQMIGFTMMLPFSFCKHFQIYTPPYWHSDPTNFTCQLLFNHKQHQKSTEYLDYSLYNIDCLVYSKILLAICFTYQFKVNILVRPSD